MAAVAEKTMGPSEAARRRYEAEAADKISQARMDLVMGRDAAAVYFATVALRLVVEPAWWLPTAATDGKRIIYNPEFICGLSRKHCLGVMAHEVMHVTNAHHARMGDRDPELWNIAADLAINPIITEAKMELPDWVLAPGRGPYGDLPAGRSTEEYYGLVLKRGKPKPGGSAPGNGPGGKSAPDPGRAGGVIKPGDGSPAACRAAEAEAKQIAAGAEQAAASAGRGDLPGGLGRSVRDLLEPKVNWRAVLRQFLTKFARNDYSWQRPNRRFIHSGIYLPGLHSEEIGSVVVAVDTSDSIDDALLRSFLSELQGILEAYAVELTILYHHSQVYRVQEWRTADGPLKPAKIETGGTSHRPVFDYIGRMVEPPTCVVCLTDMDSSFPADPGYPVLWVAPGGASRRAPFGQAVAME